MEWTIIQLLSMDRFITKLSSVKYSTIHVSHPLIVNLEVIVEGEMCENEMPITSRHFLFRSVREGM